MNIIAGLLLKAGYTATPAASPLFNVFLSSASNPSMLSILGVRLLMNIRVAAERGLSQGTSCPQARLGQNSRGEEMESGVLSELNFTEARIEADDDVNSCYI